MDGDQTDNIFMKSKPEMGPKKTLIESQFPSNSVLIAGKIHVCTLNLYGACKHDRIKIYIFLFIRGRIRTWRGQNKVEN